MRIPIQERYKPMANGRRAPYRDQVDYQLATGKQLPIFDPQLPVSYVEHPAGKYSFIKKSATGVVVFGPDGQPQLEERIFSDGIRINIPTEVKFPPYDPKPLTPYVRFGVGGQYLNESSLCTEEEARLVEKETGGTNLRIERTWQGAPIQYAVGTPWQVWKIDIDGQSYLVGELIRDRYQRGVGWPGHWEGPRFIDDPPARTLIGYKGSIEPPIELGEGERLVAGFSLMERVVEVETSAAATDPVPAGMDTKAEETNARQSEIQYLLDRLAVLIGQKAG